MEEDKDAEPKIKSEEPEVGAEIWDEPHANPATVAHEDALVINAEVESCPEVRRGARRLKRERLAIYTVLEEEMVIKAERGPATKDPKHVGRKARCDLRVTRLTTRQRTTPW